MLRIVVLPKVNYAPFVDLNINSKEGYNKIDSIIGDFIEKLFEQNTVNYDLYDIICAPKEYGGLELILPGIFHDLMKQTQQ